MSARPVLLVSCRSDSIESRNETRDALDRRLAGFIWSAGFLPVAVPNDRGIAVQTFQELRPAGVVFSGGNESPAREETERALFDLARRYAVPVFGICHGFQELIRLSGGSLQRVEGHVRTRHPLIEADGKKIDEGVNSFHELTAFDLPDGWNVLAQAPDGSIEWAKNEAQKSQGIMWHPEREPEYPARDLNIFRAHFLAQV